MAAFYPVSLNLEGRPCVVLGGGPIAEQKVINLLEAGARVTVISPEVTPRLDGLEAQGTVRITRRPYRRGDLYGAFLAIAAGEDRAPNREIWEEAEQERVLLNAVDDTPHCHFIAPAIFRQGDLSVAVSTAGKSPALGVRVRDRIGALIGPEYAAFLDLLGGLRAEVAAREPDPARRTRLWYRIVDSDALEHLRRGDVPGAHRRVASLLDATGQTPRAPDTAVPRGSVYIVGAGPGDPGLITVRGLEVLRTSDVVIYDRLVHPALLREAPPHAERIFAGKTSGHHRIAQEEISALLIARARDGQIVTRLKGGDPFVFGRGGEECEALRAAGVRFEVVPGVTSAVAVPAYAGIPVTHRSHASAFAVVTGHECGRNPDLDWGALARLPVLVVLMGLRALPKITRRLIAHGAHRSTPAAMVSNGATPHQRTITGTLATIAQLARAAGLEPPSVLVVGEVVRLQEVLRWFEPLGGSGSAVWSGDLHHETPASVGTQPTDGARVVGGGR